MSNLLEKMKFFFGFEEEISSHSHKEDRKEQIKSDPLKQPMIRSFRGALINNNQNINNKFSLAEIKVIEPKIYEDSLTISTYLRENKPVVVNLKYLDKVASKRLIDFVCGTAYAINGHMMKIGDSVFLFSPEHIHIVDSEEEKSTLEQGLEQEEKELFFKKAAFN
jgi:cell division inhibitor SepF